MGVLKPRTRLVYFRMSEEEFQEVSRRCQLEGARSLSDFARTAFKRLLDETPAEEEAALKDKLNTIDCLLSQLNQKLSEVLLLLQLQPERNGGDRHSSVAQR